MFHAFSNQVSHKAWDFFPYHCSLLPCLAITCPRAFIPAWISVTIFSAFSIFPMCPSQIHSALTVIFPKHQSCSFPILLIKSMTPHYQQVQVQAPQPVTQGSFLFDSYLLQVYPLLLWALPCMVTTLDLFPFPVKSYSFMPLAIAQIVIFPGISSFHVLKSKFYPNSPTTWAPCMLQTLVSVFTSAIWD